MADKSGAQLRLATRADGQAIQALIEVSVWALSTGDYSAEQIEAALRGVWGLDTRLIEDRTYYVAENNGRLVGCGGWSFRKTLFGADSLDDREDVMLDPATDAARIRAFFVHPDFARQGIGRQILETCEQAARQQGFTRFELGGTLPGARLYRSCGYVSGKSYEYDCGDGISMTIIPMYKFIDPAE